MKVFLSWSGCRSKAVALALKNWLPLVLQYVNPWVSDQDIIAGDRWAVELGRELDTSNFGIICLTTENLTAPWILFEAGALSKSLTLGAVCPYLVGVDYSDLTGPLAQFQSKKAEKESTKQLLVSINSRAVTPLDTNRLDVMFETFWPKLRDEINNIPAMHEATQVARSEKDVLEDLVQSVRSMETRFREFEQYALSPNKLQMSGQLSLKDPETAVKIIVGESVGELKEGQVVNLSIRHSKVIYGISKGLGLNRHEYDKSWVLYDSENVTTLTLEKIRKIVVESLSQGCTFHLYSSG